MNESFFDRVMYVLPIVGFFLLFLLFTVGPACGMDDGTQAKAIQGVPSAVECSPTVVGGVPCIVCTRKHSPDTLAISCGWTEAQ